MHPRDMLSMEYFPEISAKTHFPYKVSFPGVFLGVNPPGFGVFAKDGLPLRQLTALLLPISHPHQLLRMRD